MLDELVPQEALARLLLLQSGMSAAPDERRLCEIVARAFADLPGVHGSAVCLEGRVYRSALATHVRCEKSQEARLACTPGCAASLGANALVPIQTPRADYGGILLDVDETALDLYRPMARNVANMVALRIENDRQRSELLAMNEELERRVLDRTAQLAAEKERLAVTLASIGDAVVATDETGRVTLMNGMAERFTGFGPGDAIGQPLHEVFRMVSADTREPIAGPADRVLRGEAGEPRLVLLVARDGTERFVAEGGARVRGADGRTSGAVLVFRDRTGEVEKERVLRESEERFRVLVEQAADAFFLHDSGGRLREVNRLACESLGYTREELLRMGVCDVEDDFDLAAAQKLWGDTRPGEVKTLSGHHRRKDGSVFPVEIRLSRVDLRGERLLLCLARDVSESRRFAVALRESDQRFRSIFQQVAVGMAEIDANDGRFVRVNDKLCEIVGYGREEMKALRWGNLAPGETLLSDLKSFEQMFTGRRSYTWQKRHLRPDGVEVWLELTLAPMWSAGENPTSFVSVVEDVTARKEAEQALTKSEERFRALIEKSTDMIQLLDAEGRFRFWSPSTEEALGWTQEENIGRHALEAVHPEDQERIGKVLADLISRPGGAARETFRYRHKDGSWRVVDARARNLLQDPAVGAVVVNSRDMTEQRLLEDQLRQSQKLESVGRLAGGVAHDFNNLLTVILSCAETLTEGLGVESRHIEDVREIHTATERARELTRQLLAFARKQVIAPKPVDLNSVVRGNQRMLSRLLGEDVDLRVELQSDLWTAVADPGQVEQVLLNLVVNARDAMPKGGTIVIGTQNRTTSEQQAALEPDRVPGDWVRLIVRDTGVGMTPEVRSHLFEPFFTTKEKGKGTGLGLATVYGIVKQSGGHIHIASEPDRGTAFEICLPRAARPAAPAGSAAPVAARGGTEALLVVEDDPMVRNVTVRALRGVGYQVRIAASAKEALELAPAELATLRLVITDVVMPGLDGPSMARELCQRNPELRVLYVSGYSDDAISNRGVLSAGIRFLPKPFTRATLLAKVREALDAGG